MAEWIKNLKDEKGRKEEEYQRESNEGSRISGMASYLVKDLICICKAATDELNREFHEGRQVYEVSDNMGYFNRFEEDFVVMSQVFPAAYLFVKLAGYKRALKRKLVIKVSPEARRIEKALPDLEVKLDATGNPIYLENGQILSTDDIAQLLVEPVYRAHAKS